jgi:hypothetical protein
VIVLYPALLIAAIVLIIRRDREGGHGWGWFVAWAFAGAAFFFSFLTGLSIGLLLLPAVAVVVLFVAARAPHAAESAGFFAGVGLVIVGVSLASWGDGEASYATWLVVGAIIAAAATMVYLRVTRTR